MEKIVVVGSVILDIAAYTPAFSEDGLTRIGEKLKISPGGKGFNQAAAAKLAGAEVSMVAKLGNDLFSDYLFRHYEKIGFNTRYMVKDPEQETGSAIIEINTKTAENRIILLKGANDALTAEDVRRAEKAFEECRLVLTQLETGMEAVVETKRLAKKYGKALVINTAPYRPIPDGLFNEVDYITPNETEASYYSGIEVKDMKSARSAAKELLKMGARNIIITLGGQGSYYTDGEVEYEIPAIRAGDAVDTTGAGDAYNAGLCVALSEGRNIKDALLFASCTAGLKVTRRGSSVAMPAREKINNLFFRIKEEQHALCQGENG